MEHKPYLLYFNQLSLVMECFVLIIILLIRATDSMVTYPGFCGDNFWQDLQQKV